jgi:uncharacterized protein YaiL (DUF2058 family)
VVENLSSKLKDLSSNLSTTKKKKKDQQLARENRVSMRGRYPKSLHIGFERDF